MEEIKESMSQMQQLFVKQMDDFQAQFHKQPTPASTASLATEFAAFRSFILNALQVLQNQVQYIAHSQDNMEMQSRRKILLFHGLPELKNEDVAAIVVGTVVDKLKLVDFSASSISRCHRMGRTAAADNKRPILVKIRDQSVRSKIWSAKACLKGTGVTMSEFLTKSRHDVFMVARQRFGVTRSWTREGSVFVLGPDGTRHRVSCLSELDKIGAPSGSISPKQAPAVPKDIAITKTRRAAASKK